jgi:hypothetical protein
MIIIVFITNCFNFKPECPKVAGDSASYPTLGSNFKGVCLIDLNALCVLSMDGQNWLLINQYGLSGYVIMPATFI